MNTEKWQGLKNQLVIDKDKAIIASDDEVKDLMFIKEKLVNEGQPVNEVRHKMLRDTVKRQVEVNTLKVKQHFDRKHDFENAEKVEKLKSNSPVKQVKQIKNEAMFFGQSFLEGFLGVYGLELDNAVERYENKLHVLETQDLTQDNPEKKYYIGRIKNGQSDIATSEIPSREIAESELDKFYSKSREQEQTQVQPTLGIDRELDSEQE